MRTDVGEGGRGGGRGELPERGSSENLGFTREVGQGSGRKSLWFSGLGRRTEWEVATVERGLSGMRNFRTDRAG